MDTQPEQRFISLGMYAFTPPLQQAWQTLYSTFLNHWPHSALLDSQCHWEHGTGTLSQPSMLFGYTCGYPLTHELRGLVTPFCVPVFNVRVCTGTQYSSQFIVHAESSINTLADCRGLVAACNNSDSNSGMNVFRSAIARLANGTAYFDSVVYTGGHLASMQQIAEGKADVAAIDAVSFQLAVEAFPSLARQVRSIGLSESTGALPLVYRSDDHAFDADLCLDLLNQSLRDCPDRVAQYLHLQGFERVTLADYDSINEIEQAAIKLGYPELK